MPYPYQKTVTPGLFSSGLLMRLQSWSFGAGFLFKYQPSCKNQHQRAVKLVHDAKRKTQTTESQSKFRICAGNQTYPCSKDKTFCLDALACASIAVKACCKIIWRANTVDSVAKSESSMRPFAAWIFTEANVKFEIVWSILLKKEPTFARCLHSSWSNQHQSSSWYCLRA